MSEGGYNDDNFVYMINPSLSDYSVTYSGISYVEPKDPLVVCPINTYLSEDKQCF
jgi:hypothetical protein